MNYCSSFQVADKPATRGRLRVRLSRLWLPMSASASGTANEARGGYVARSIVRPSQFIAAPRSHNPKEGND